MINKYFVKRSILGIILFSFILSFQLKAQNSFNPDTVKSQKLDTGKMWTFEFPPFEYFKEKYGFTPTKEWFDDVRLSAVRIPGCSASFVSEDGLIMTNNHCSRGSRRQVQKEGEDLAATAFIANSLEEERRVPNYTAEQMVFLKDVTDEVQAALKKAKDSKEKAQIREAKMKELKERFEKETSLKCDVVTYYNGSLFFVQGFKTFTDVRLVFQPEEAIAYFGGDPDNFTYPRYNLDCTFLRIYDETGKPVKSPNYFKWSKAGAKENELVFTVGNPGTTNRLRTVAQLEYMRDVQFRNNAFLQDNLYNKLEQLKSVNPSKADEYERMRLAFSNGQKNTSQTNKALNDPYLMARKKDFEKKAQDYVNNNPELKKDYGHVWKTIESTRKELKAIDTKLAAYQANGQFFARYMIAANTLVGYAKNMLLPVDKRNPMYAQLSSKVQEATPAQPQAQRGGGQRGFGAALTRENIFPANFDKILEDAKLEISLEYLAMNLGKDNDLFKKLTDGKSIKEASKNLIAKTSLKSKEAVLELLDKTPEEILSSNDPFIQYYSSIFDEIETLRNLQREALTTENDAFSLLGQIYYKMYGTTITPDANRTLRISDGIMKGYNYNGTVAPYLTTFYGMYDRFYGFEGKYPFNLPARWQTPPPALNLLTPFNFVATNDIIGGNSGSAIINKNAEVIGLAFDGNIEMLQGNFIYYPYDNRTVGVDSRGMLEAIKNVYKINRLSSELENGKMSN